MKNLRRLLAGVLAALSITAALPLSAMPAKALQFIDVPSDKWSTYAIDWVTNAGHMAGIGNGLFDPTGAMTRGMVVTVLYQLSGADVLHRQVFTDVPDNRYYARAVVWAYDSGIVSGTGGGLFSPDMTITREQCATMLFKYAGLQGRDTSARADINLYDDGNLVSAYAREPVAWIVREGIITGTSNRTLGATEVLTREQFALILMRFLTGGRDYIPPTPVTSAYNPPAGYGSYTEAAYPLVTNADFYVSPAGDDSADGSIDTPFRSFARAQRAAREASGITVVAFKAGYYGALEVLLEGADSGNVFCKYGDGDVIFEGGGDGYQLGFHLANNVTIRGFTFRAAPRTVLTMNEASGLTFENCVFENLYNAAQYAVDCYKPERITFKNCEFKNIQGGGIFFRGDLNGNYQNLTSSGNVIENCLFDRYCLGTTEYDMSAVMVNEVAGTRIANNEFSNAPWCAIRFLAVDTVVEKNVIHDIAFARADYGAVYTGRSLVDRGSRISNNLIFNLSSATGNPNEIYGIYLDDGIAGQTVTNNLFYNAGNCAVLINGGRDNTVSGNVVIDTTSGELGGILSSGKYYDYAVNGRISEMNSWPGLRDSLQRIINENAWRAKFPAIFSINMDPGAYNDPACVVVPTGTSVTDNTYIGNAGYKTMAQAELFVVNSNNLRYELTMNPFFVDPASGNYNITSGGPAINMSQIGRY